MAPSLPSLLSRLSGDVAPRNGVPSQSQYEQCIKDAVADLSDRAPMRRIVELSVVAGTASYPLPADFVRFGALAGLPLGDRTVITPGGLLPTGGVPFEEEVTIAGTTLTIYPAPDYSMVRRLDYWAGHLLSEADLYPTLADADVRLVMLKAQSLALMLQANRAAQEAWTYQVAEERVSKEKLAAELRGQAAELLKTYEAQVATRVAGERADRPRAYGTRYRHARS